jgi:hypothetical protein
VTDFLSEELKYVPCLNISVTCWTFYDIFFLYFENRLALSLNPWNSLVFLILQYSLKGCTILYGYRMRKNSWYKQRYGQTNKQIKQHRRWTFCLNDINYILHKVPSLSTFYATSINHFAHRCYLLCWQDTFTHLPFLCTADQLTLQPFCAWPSDAQQHERFRKLNSHFAIAPH